MTILGNFIAGQPQASHSGRTAEVFDPASGEVTRQVALSSADETRDANRVADEAYPGWAKMSPLKRSRILFKFKALVEEHADEIARLISSEHG